MQVLSGIQGRLPCDVYSKVARYRHQIFVERLGWQLHTRDGTELDQFDRPDTIYVVAQDDDGHVVGCARLLPTTRPYLLQEIFPQLLNGLPPPSSRQIWELSRFAAADLSTRPGTHAGQLSSPIAVQLMQEAIRTAAILGARQLITVSRIGIERLLKRAGFVARRAGPPMIVNGHSTFACWIDVAER